MTTAEQTAPSCFPGRVGFVQRVLPPYRAAFFDLLASRCTGGLQVLAGDPREGEGHGTETDALHQAVHVPTRNVYLGDGSGAFHWQRGLADWLRGWHPDVVVCDTSMRCLTTVLARWKMRGKNRRVLGWGLGTLRWDAPTWVLRGRRALLSLHLRTFDGIVAYSTNGARQYAGLGVPRRSLFVAPNAVSAEHAHRLSAELRSAPSIVNEWKREHALEGKPIVLFVGRLLPAKRVDRLIRACARLEGECHLVVVGDGPAMVELKSLAASVHPSTRFLGALHGRDLAFCFAGSDLFVLPGLGGLAVQEAMIHGLPVIVGESDGTQQDLVKEGRNGHFLTRGDEGELCRALRQYLSDADHLAAMGEESRRIVADEVNLEKMVAGFLGAIAGTTTARIHQQGESDAFVAGAGTTLCPPGEAAGLVH